VDRRHATSKLCARNFEVACPNRRELRVATEVACRKSEVLMTQSKKAIATSKLRAHNFEVACTSNLLLTQRHLVLFCRLRACANALLTSIRMPLHPGSGFVLRISKKIQQLAGTLVQILTSPLHLHRHCHSEQSSLPLTSSSHLSATNTKISVIADRINNEEC